MTRINNIPPRYLTDQHLMAEYREITHVPNMLLKSLKATGGETLKIGNLLKTLPDTFTLNKGHVKFFYDKGLYLSNRFLQLKQELKMVRGFDIDISRQYPLSYHPATFRNDWKPDVAARELSLNRILQRIDEKLGWYKYYGVEVKDSRHYLEMVLIKTQE